MISSWSFSLHCKVYRRRWSNSTDFVDKDRTQKHIFVKKIFLSHLYNGSKFAKIETAVTWDFSNLGPKVPEISYRMSIKVYSTKPQGLGFIFWMTLMISSLSYFRIYSGFNSGKNQWCIKFLNNTNLFTNVNQSLLNLLTNHQTIMKGQKLLQLPRPDLQISKKISELSLEKFCCAGSPSKSIWTDNEEEKHLDLKKRSVTSYSSAWGKLFFSNLQHISA